MENLLRGVEGRYNTAKTLQVLFKEEYTPPGHARRTESGIIMLRKPGKMRWDYSQPPGKQFVSDGKMIWLYTPSENSVEKSKFKESEDMRVPLAFLLGRLHFDKEFRNIQAHPEGAATRITAEPKSDNLPYSSVEFVVGADSHILEVKVAGFDKSVLRFIFDQERLNPNLDAKLFQFQVPKGAQVVEAGQ
jgi:outer membrane lipoprotein carrier protein